jgi:hypothetical protein
MTMQYVTNMKEYDEYPVTTNSRKKEHTVESERDVTSILRIRELCGNAFDFNIHVTLFKKQWITQKKGLVQKREAPFR